MLRAKFNSLFLVVPDDFKIKDGDGDGDGDGDDEFKWQLCDDGRSGTS